MFWTDTWVVQTGANGVGLCDLSVFCLEDVSSDTVEDTWDTACEGCAVPASIDAYSIHI